MRNAPLSNITPIKADLMTSPSPIRVLVAYASRAGSTKGIAEFIGQRLRERGALVDVLGVETVSDLGNYDAFVIGSALYQFHWLKEAKRFVSQNRSLLASRPVWIFSSGPTGPRATNKKGQDLKEVSGPKEIEELREWVHPRDHRVFFGALFIDRIKGAAGLFARWIPKDAEGDFRDWKEIGVWTDGITEALSALPTSTRPG
jgi:menaquinone-dependent protoporphyrinogen oxidase